MTIHRPFSQSAIAALTQILSGVGSANEAQLQAQRQLESAQQQLQLAALPGGGLDEISINCLPAPITTTPVGPTWTFEVLTSASARVRGTAWRQPCSGIDAQFILTLQPLQGTPFVCGSDMEISIGAARTDDIFLERQSE